MNTAVATILNYIPLAPSNCHFFAAFAGTISSGSLQQHRFSAALRSRRAV